MENQILDNQFYAGALPDPKDERDFPYDEVAGGGEIDWEKGYDIREELGADFKPKNQFRSYSCVAQATSQYLWVHQILEMIKKYEKPLDILRVENPADVEEISAKAIYSQIAIGKGAGSYIRDAMLLGLKWGSVFEEIVPSYKPDGTTDEDFMYDDSWKKLELDQLARILRGKEARYLSISMGMDLFANAIKENKGVLGGVYASNNRGWGYLERPEPPQEGDSIWGHGLYFGAYGQDEYGKYIAFPNSWGKIVSGEWKLGSKPGVGWQKIYKNYFDTNKLFNPWTFTDRPNEYVEEEGKFKYKFTKPILFRQTSNEVKMLQKALKIDGCFPQDQTETGYYGIVTQTAVMEFQYKYKVASPEELREVSGMSVGPKTRNQLNNLFNK